MQRRTLLANAAALTGAVVVAGCAADEPAAVQSSTPSSPTSSDTTTPTSDRVILGPTSDVPVGGGKVYSVEGVVVTQPEAGTFKAFGVRCPHQGCAVSAVTGKGIVCPCHNSLFSVSDGSPTAGPANSPLSTKSVTVDGGNLLLG